MAKTQEFYVDIDMKKNAVKNVKFEIVTALPATPFKGQVVEFEGVLQTYNGTKWVKYADDAQVQINKTNITSLQETVGDPESGLVKTVNELKTQVGTDAGGNTLGTRVANLETALGTAADEAAADGSAYARIAKNTAGIATNAAAAADAKSAAEAAQKDATSAKNTAADNSAAITTLQETDKTQTSDIRALKTDVGTKASGDVAATGLFKDVAANTAAIANVKATADAAAVKADVDNALAGKVDKVEGKGLSTNDYTTAEKNKLTGIATGAQVNVIESVKVDGTALAITEKAVNIDLSGYAKKEDISRILKYCGSVEDLSGLPESPADGDVYNIKKEFTYKSKKYPAETNVVWVAANGDVAGYWDPLGGTVDLSNYATTTEVTTSIETAVKVKQDKLTEAQLAAADSGITADKVAAYDGYAASIKSAADAATAAKTAADGKVAKNADIEASTAAKLVTYDAKGLVTGGKAIEASDLPAKIPVAKIDGVLPLAQSSIIGKTVPVTVTDAAGGDVAINAETTGMTTVLIVQVFDGNNNAVQCGISVTGGTATLSFSAAFTGSAHVIGLV